MTNRCPLCHENAHYQHDTDCPLGLLMRWQASIPSPSLNRSLSQLDVGNSASWSALRDYCESLGGGEQAGLQFFAGMAVNIFTQIQQVMTDIIEKKQTESSTAGKPDQPPASISSEKAAKDSVPDAGGRGASPAPSKSDEWLDQSLIPPSLLFPIVM
jgi:hypothetical protein